MSKFKAYECIIGATTIKQVVRVRYDPGARVDGVAAAGAKARSDIFGLQAAPRCTIETFDIEGVLDAMGVEEDWRINVAAGTITIPWNKFAQGGTFEGTLKHFTLSGTDGLAVLRSIEARQGQPFATATIELFFRSTDGFTDPVGENVNQTLAASNYNATHAMRKAVLNGTDLKQAMDFRVNTGLQVLADHANGGLYPDTISLGTPFEPTIDVSIRDLDQLNTDDAIWAAGTTLACYLGKRDKASYVADGSLVHASLSFGAGLTAIEDLGGPAEGNDFADTTIRYHGLSLSEATSVAIP